RLAPRAPLPGTHRAPGRRARLVPRPAHHARGRAEAHRRRRLLHDLLQHVPHPGAGPARSLDDARGWHVDLRPGHRPARHLESPALLDRTRDRGRGALRPVRQPRPLRRPHGGHRAHGPGARHRARARRAAPVLGTGFATFGVAFPPFRTLQAPVVFSHAESDWVQLLTDTGVVGLALALAAVGSLGLAVLRRYRHTESRWPRALALAGL